MFTLEQIRNAHSKVKSGADFPSYIAELKALGITRYDHFLSDGHTTYTGSGDYHVEGPAKWQKMDVSEVADVAELRAALKIHQGGATDYMTFCRQAAAAGVVFWRVNIEAMSCIYYDANGREMVVEIIPQPGR